MIYENKNGFFKITPEDLPNLGIMFVDHSKNNRGGHFGHALIEYADNKILAFYPNCNTDNNGHSGRGWMEYKRSEDGGLTWSDGVPFEYSKRLYDLNIGFTSINEKAVLADDGKIILFNLICDVSKSALWEPYVAPTYMTSSDGGHTWSRAKRFTSLHGRVYDVYKEDGIIYVLMACCYNPSKKSDSFRLFCSVDNGESFHERSRLPFEPDRFYGTLEVLPDGRLIAYTYTSENEYMIEYVTSDNKGKSWSEIKTTFFEQRIRNPQIVKFMDSYFAFGRSGQYGERAGNIILYCSEDGLNWDSGRCLAMKTAGIGAYSNTLITGGLSEHEQKRLLFQSSHAYLHSQTNILHWWVDYIEK